MNFLGNLAWIVFGGLIISLIYLLSGVVLCITIIGIPFGMQLFKLASLSLAPFGYESVEGDRQSGCLYILFNILWIITGGLSLAVTHLFFAIIFFVTIIGIPLAMQHIKLIPLALMPFGRDIVPKD